MLHATDVGVLIAFTAKRLVVGFSELSPQIVVVGQLGEFDNFGLAAKAGNAKKTFIL